jgi:hypothetical protein
MTDAPDLVWLRDDLRLDDQPFGARRAGVKLGRDYPAPIVDHGSARRRALAAYEKMRRSPSFATWRSRAGDSPRLDGRDGATQELKAPSRARESRP